jgi:hypothetical protein
MPYKALYKPFKATQKCPYCSRMMGKFSAGKAHPQCLKAKKKPVKYEKYKIYSPEAYPLDGGAWKMR